MQIGVERFEGRKLQDAIEFRQVSKKEIAENVEVSPSNITKYIQGALKPSPAVFERLALALQFPQSFFLADWKHGVFENPELWRSFKSATQRARKKGKVVLKWQVTLYQLFKGYFDELPEFSVPDLDVPISFEQIDNEFIDNYCLKLRELWGLGASPIRNLIRVLENRGVCVCMFDLGNPKLDAVSLFHERVPYILINEKVSSSARMRFNLAHELGHILLHRSIHEDDLEDDSKFDQIEEQAHYFATSLLLPEIPLSNDFWAPTLKCIEGVKAKWNVSMQATMRRCLELGLITSSQFSYLNIAISKKGWRQSEPLDDITPFERPMLFKLAVSRVSERHSVSGSNISEQTGLPLRVLSDLTQVDESELTESESISEKIVRFRRD